MPLRPALLLLNALLFPTWSIGAACAGPPPLRVLFVGNSHTATHDLPGTVAALAERHGVDLEVERLVEPGHSLADHLARGDLQRRLAGQWDWVVLQQGPSARPASRAELIRSVEAIAARLQGRPVRIALMSTWPDQRHRGDSLAAESSHRDAAIAVGACVLPVATAWRHALAADAPPRLYQRDRLHATATGTVLAALTIAPAFADRMRTPPATTDAGSSGKTPRLRELEAAAWRAWNEETQRCD